jgi:hypothetical protein
MFFYFVRWQFPKFQCRERKNHLWHVLWSQDKLKLVSTGFTRWEESYGDYFKSKCSLKKKIYIDDEIFSPIWFGLDWVPLDKKNLMCVNFYYKIILINKITKHDEVKSVLHY